MNFLFKTILFFLITLNLHAKQINVYLLFKDPTLYQSIQSFNSYLEDKGVFSRYQIEPFLTRYPLHITLFLADYSEKNRDQLNYQVATLAARWHSITVKTTQLFVTHGNYVLLDLDNANLPDGSNPEIQQLSDQVTLALSGLRNFNAKIPDWAESIPEKRKAFLRYGSPNVFFEFNPHVTLMAKNFSDPSEAQAFQNEVSRLIQSYPFPEVSLQASAIALGYVDDFGQITQEIATFQLGF